MFLLDTPIVLELRKARAGQADAGLTAWASGMARERLFLSALTLLELQEHAARIAAHDKPGGAALRSWIEERVLPAFDGQMLAVDLAVVRRREGLAIPDNRDALLAATALEHGLTLVTRNGAAFKGTKVRLFDPRGYTPDADDDADWRAAARTGSLWLKNLFVRT